MRFAFEQRSSAQRADWSVAVTWDSPSALIGPKHRGVKSKQVWTCSSVGRRVSSLFLASSDARLHVRDAGQRTRLQDGGERRQEPRKYRDRTTTTTKTTWVSRKASLRVEEHNLARYIRFRSLGNDRLAALGAFRRCHRPLNRNVRFRFKSRSPKEPLCGKCPHEPLAGFSHLRTSKGKVRPACIRFLG